MKPVAKWAHSDQSGFTKGRQGLTNITDIDAHARRVDLVARAANVRDTSLLPQLLCFDFAAAFPSLSHAFLFLTLLFHVIPDGLMRFLETLYDGNKCFGVFDGVQVFLYEVRAGILQGCPLSGTLFVFVVTLDVFLRYLAAMLPGSVTGAFADDIASISKELRELPILFEAFELFGEVSCLLLKPRKCCVVPLGDLMCEELLSKVKHEIARLVPKWMEFKVKDCAEYLGFIVGPRGGSESSWAKPLRNYVERAAQLGCAGLAASLSCELFHFKVHSTLGYVAQLAMPTKELILKEEWAHNKTLHVVPKVLPRFSAQLLSQSGAKCMPSIAVTAGAALLRTALRTCCWRETAQLLNETRYNCGPLISFAPKLCGTEGEGLQPITINGRPPRLDSPW